MCVCVRVALTFMLQKPPPSPAPANHHSALWNRIAGGTENLSKKKIGEEEKPTYVLRLLNPTTIPKTDTSAQSVLPSPRTPSPNHQLDRQADGPEDEDDEPSYQNTEMVKAAAAAASASAATKAPTTNGTTASDSTAKHGELELNGNGSAPKENGQPAATAVTESVPATTNGTLHHPPSASTNQLPQPDHHHQTHPPTANGLASNARGAQENGVHETTVTDASANAAPTTDVPAATVATTADAAAAAAASANTDAAVPTPTTTGAAAVLQTSNTNVFKSSTHYSHTYINTTRSLRLTVTNNRYVAWSLLLLSLLLLPLLPPLLLLPLRLHVRTCSASHCHLSSSYRGLNVGRGRRYGILATLSPSPPLAPPSPSFAIPPEPATGLPVPERSRPIGCRGHGNTNRLFIAPSSSSIHRNPNRSSTPRVPFYRSTIASCRIGANGQGNADATTASSTSERRHGGNAGDTQDYFHSNTNVHHYAAKA